MTAPMDDTLTVIGWQLVAFLPTVQEPLPTELKDLVAKLVPSEMRKRDSIASPLQFVMAQMEPDPSSTDPSIGR